MQKVSSCDFAACDFSLRPKNLSAWSRHARKNLWYPGQSWRAYCIETPSPTPPPRPPNNTTITPLKIPHWVMLTLNNRELKQGHCWETRVNRKWGFFPWLCLQVLPNVYCYRAVVKCRGRGFPLATMNAAAATFIGTQKKNRTKRNP